MELDHGAVLRKETGLDTSKNVRLVIDNPLSMKEMAKHVPDAEALAVARDMDSKIENLLRESAA
jgi:hypothetical protein